MNFSSEKPMEKTFPLVKGKYNLKDEILTRESTAQDYTCGVR